MQIVGYRRSGLTQCPKCSAKGRRSDVGDTACYCTRQPVHYMCCWQCGHQFKALDYVSGGELQRLDVRNRLFQAVIAAHVTVGIVKVRRKDFRRAKRELQQAARACKAARGRLEVSRRAVA